MREKLIDIITDYADFLDWERIDGIADTIMAECFATDNNVGGKWQSVTDRLPLEEYEYWIELMDWDVYPLLAVVENHISKKRYVTKLFFDGTHFVDDELVRYTSSVTHWMPLPPPPKEE